MRQCGQAFRRLGRWLLRNGRRRSVNYRVHVLPRTEGISAQDQHFAKLEVVNVAGRNGLNGEHPCTEGVEVTPGKRQAQQRSLAPLPKRLLGKSQQHDAATAGWIANAEQASVVVRRWVADGHLGHH